MFRIEGRKRFFEWPVVRYGLVGIFFTATLCALWILRDIARERSIERDVPLLAVIIVVLAVAGTCLFLVYRAYGEMRDRLAYVKLFAYDVLQSLPVGVITTDLSGLVTHVNEQARRLSGVGPDPLRQPYATALAGTPALLSHLERLVAHGEEFSGKDIDVASNGRSMTLRLEGHFLMSDTGEKIGAILQLQDVSQLKLLDQEMRRTEQLASLGTVAAGIAHEIKNPLAGLSINAQLLQEVIPAASSSNKAGKYVRVIQSEVGRLQAIVDNYVGFARPRAVERTAASFEGIAESILSLVEPECQKKKITVIREGFSPTPPRYLIDPGQIQQAILNIVINAIQAMENGGQLTIRLGRAASFAVFEIGDTGLGIPPDARDRIFDLFYTTRRGGTGLGLYLAQRIVAEHKGYIDLKTGAAGTTFTVALPAESAK